MIACDTATMITAVIDIIRSLSSKLFLYGCFSLVPSSRVACQ